MMQTPTNQINASHRRLPLAPLQVRYRSIDLQGDFRRNLFDPEDTQDIDDVYRPLPYVSRSSHQDIFSFFGGQQDHQVSFTTPTVTQISSTSSKARPMTANEEKVKEAKNMAFNLYLAIQSQLLEEILVPKAGSTIEQSVLRATRTVLRKRKRSSR